MLHLSRSFLKWIIFVVFHSMAQLYRASISSISLRWCSPCCFFLFVYYFGLLLCVSQAEQKKMISSKASSITRFLLHMTASFNDSYWLCSLCRAINCKINKRQTFVRKMIYSIKTTNQCHDISRFSCLFVINFEFDWNAI